MHTNGYLSLDVARNMHVPQPFPLTGTGSGDHIIAPFLADIDTRCRGRVYYEQPVGKKLDRLLGRAKVEIGNDMFDPTALMMVTWKDVGFFINSVDCSVVRVSWKIPVL